MSFLFTTMPNFPELLLKAKKVQLVITDSLLLITRKSFMSNTTTSKAFKLRQYKVKDERSYSVVRILYEGVSVGEKKNVEYFLSLKLLTFTENLNQVQAL